MALLAAALVFSGLVVASFGLFLFVRARDQRHLILARVGGDSPAAPGKEEARDGKEDAPSSKPSHDEERKDPERPDPLRPEDVCGHVPSGSRRRGKGRSHGRKRK